MTAKASSGDHRDPADLSDVESGLRSAKIDTFEAAVHAAVERAAEGDRLLAAALSRLRGWRAVYVAAVLGDADGSHGGNVLRSTIDSRGRGTSDLRCAALLALAKTEGVHASEPLSRVVDDADRAVRAYAVLTLAAVGDARAWDAVLKRLKAMVARTRTMESGDDLSPVVLAVTYLLRHAGEDGRRVRAVVSVLRLRWSRLTERERRWLREQWPGVEPLPGGTVEPNLPNPNSLQQHLLDHPLFARPAVI